MSSNTQEIFNEISRELQWLHVRWIFYRQLFESSQKRRIDLLNESASLSFWLVESSFIDGILLGLCKLTDPANTGRKDNLTFKQLQIAVEDDDPNLPPDIKKKLKDTLDNLDKCEEFRKHRNKRLTHLDLETALGTALNPLPPVTVQMIEETLEYMRDYLNAIEQHYDDRETGYDNISLSFHGDGEALVYLLKQGLRYKQLLEEGNLPYEDLSKSKWKDA